MSYRAPTLTTTIDAALYRTQIDANFALIQQALRDIQNAIPSYGGRTTQANLTWVETALLPDGIIGVESFVPVIETDEDAITVSHNAPNGISSCVIDGSYHESNGALTKSLSEVVTSDGTYEVIFGAKSLGAPAMEMVFEIQSTDRSSELALYSMTVTRSGSAFTVTDLRLEATVILDNDAFDRVFSFGHPLTFHYSGALPSSAGTLPTGVVVPFDARVEGAWLHLVTAPSSSTVEVQIVDSDDTDGNNVFTGSVSWGLGDDRRSEQLFAPNRAEIVRAGTMLRPVLVQADSGGGAADLSGSILVSRVYHEVR